MRKAALASNPSMTIREEGGNWTIITKTIVRSFELNFRLGEEFEELTTDGRKCKTMVIIDGDKLITTQKALKPGEMDVSAVRHFTDSGLRMTMTCKGVTSTQEYKRD